MATWLISPFDGGQPVFAVSTDAGSDPAGDENVVIVGDYVDIGNDTRNVETQLEDRVNIAGNSGSGV